METASSTISAEGREGMAKVEYCDKCGFINQQCECPEPRTNADRIRAMSDEELAMTMMCPNENGLAEIDCDQNDSCNCYECLLKWLRAEVEEEHVKNISN